MPVDFDAYSIMDRSTADKVQEIDLQKPIPDTERVWRISSLTTFVDADTKILLLPVPESKRKVKILDTKYNFSKYEDLVERKGDIERGLKEKEERNVRFEDKT